jgi:hypothetical protein
MKQILDDIVQHTHLMGLFPALKIHTNENNETIIESMAEDKSVVLQAITNSPIPDFNYTFGMGNIEKLNTLLKCPEYKDDPIIKVIKSDKDDQKLPIAIEFNNKNNDFKNHYRLMNTEIINEKLKSIRLKQIYWEIDFEPSDTSMQKFKYQVALNNQEKNFSVTTTAGNLIFNFGDQGSYYGSYIFEKNVSKKLRNKFSWPISQTLSLFNLPGSKKIKFSNEGAMMITVTSNHAVYNYILPARA